MQRLEAAPRQALDPVVVWVGAAAAASSGGALVVSILAETPLWLASTFIFLPGLIALIALSVGLRRDQQALFLTRLRVGLLAGVIGTLAYDVVRWFVEVTDLAGTNTFVAIPMFGAGLTGKSSTEPVAIAAGWAFHFCNGIGFAIAYVMIAASRIWPLGIAFALVLEGFMVVLYPVWEQLGMSLTAEFLSVSILGHVAYGLTLGLMGERSK